MDTLNRVESWLVAAGLAGATETELLDGFCDRWRGTEVELSRATLIVDTLHPTHEGHVFRWRVDSVEPEVVEYGPSNVGQAAAQWQSSPFYRLVTTGGSELRRRIGPGEPEDFAILGDMKAEGLTDYVVFVHRFGAASIIGEMDCVYSSWATASPGGFRDADLEVLRRVVPLLALAVKGVSLTRIARTLVEVYLGHDAGERVLSGRISRGVADRIKAVIWFSDLRGYTKITDTAPPEEIIPLLNDYSAAVIGAVRAESGEVLKLIGDGVLAIFRADDPAEACRRALRAMASLKAAVKAVNERRAAGNHPVTDVYLGLHIGEVFYGNIGSDDRLDFTVVGPAVNEASRIAAMCRSVDRGVVFSAEFAAATPEPERSMLVSVGRYALRGVGRAEELFTLDPALQGQG
ncbi:MAG TPA: adenylate/guanylate cyclase domain-containing protein [Burkholderiaceae bacterium]|nr:adenylate/guanylate cyclase domain-containing protein [Burkholderiaceae bacterium]